MTVSLTLANAFYAYVVKSCVNISVTNLIIRMIVFVCVNCFTLKIIVTFSRPFLIVGLNNILFRIKYMGIYTMSCETGSDILNSCLLKFGVFVIFAVKMFDIKQYKLSMKYM